MRRMELRNESKDRLDAILCVRAHAALPAVMDMCELAGFYIMGVEPLAEGPLCAFLIFLSSGSLIGDFEKMKKVVDVYVDNTPLWGGDYISWIIL